MRVGWFIVARSRLREWKAFCGGSLRLVSARNARIAATIGKTAHRSRLSDEDRLRSATRIGWNRQRRSVGIGDENRLKSATKIGWDRRRGSVEIGDDNRSKIIREYEVFRWNTVGGRKWYWWSIQIQIVKYEYLNKLIIIHTGCTLIDEVKLLR